MAYLLDANVFIQAKNREYGFDFCPAFWEWMDIANAAELVFSVDQVRSELLAGTDDLAGWARTHDSGFFHRTDEAVLAKLGALTEWALGSDYTADAKDEFINDAADIHLVSYAFAYPHTIVTHERPSGSKKHIKIPNVAAIHGLRIINPYLMLRIERARFVLDRAA